MRRNYKFIALGMALGGLLATGGTALAQTAEQGVQLTQTQIGAAQALAARRNAVLLALALIALVSIGPGDWLRLYRAFFG